MNNTSNKYIKFDCRIDFLISCMPLAIIIIAIVMGRQVVDTDALCYHLYYARVINELNLGYYSERPVLLENTLGFGLSAYYPWLFSHVIAFIVRCVGVDYSNAAFIFSTLLYTVICLSIKRGYRWLLAIYLLMPLNFNFFFTSGANFPLIIFLCYLYYTVQNIESICKNKQLKWMLLLTLGYMAIGTHVFAPYIIFVLGMFKSIERKSNKFLIIPLALMAYVFYNNWMLTGSPTFPFLQDFFPHKNYIANEWYVIKEQIRKGIFFESVYGLYRFIPQIFINTAILYLIWKRSNLLWEGKVIISILFIPTYLFFILGYRHRFIFDMLVTLIVISKIEFITIDFVAECRRIENWLTLNKKRFIEIVVSIWAFSFIGLGGILMSYEKRKIGVDDVKNCFYKKVSDISVENKILFTEIELMNIKNPLNIINSDGAFYTEVMNLNNINEFEMLIKKRGIKYITKTPLSSDIPWNQINAHDKYVTQMIAEEKLVLAADCVSENHMNSDLLPFYENYGIKNWKIYKVKE